MKRELPEEGISAVSSLLGALQPFFALKGTLPARCKAFLLVALQEGLSVSEYAERAGISMSTMSRNLLDIGDRSGSARLQELPQCLIPDLTGFFPGAKPKRYTCEIHQKGVCLSVEESRSRPRRIIDDAFH
jgi:hypothetical protein